MLLAATLALLTSTYYSSDEKAMKPASPKTESTPPPKATPSWGH